MKITKIKFECSSMANENEHFEFQATTLEELYSNFLKHQIISGDPDIIHHKFTREELWVLVHKEISRHYHPNWYVWDSSQEQFLNIKEVLAFDWNDMIFLKR